jgi:hypothetical protein
VQTDERILEIFRKLERTLNTSLSKVIRERLIEDDYIREHLDYLDGNDAMVDWEELRNKAAEELRWEKRLRRQWLETPIPETQRPFHVRKPLPQEISNVAPWVVARADANSVYIAEAAEKYPSVLGFREYVLGDNWPLTKDQAYSFLESPAAAFFPFEWFEEWNIPFIKHYAQIKGEYRVQEFGCDIDHRASVYIHHPLYVVRRVRYAHEDAPLPVGEEIDAQNVVLYISMGADAGKKVKPPHRKSLPHRRTDWAAVNYPWIWPGSVLDYLRSLGERVAKEQHQWDAEDAIWFILTGEAPFLSPVVEDVRFSPGAKLRGVEKLSAPEADIPAERRIIEENRPSTANIILTVEPWVPADLVKSIYRSLQLKLVGTDKPSWKRNLKVYFFVKEKQKEGIDPSSLHNLWNQEVQKDWHYKRKHGFWQAYELARQTVEDVTFTNPRDIPDW